MSSVARRGWRPRDDLTNLRALESGDRELYGRSERRPRDSPRGWGDGKLYRRSSKDIIIDRVIKAFVTRNFADCTFVVSDREIKAHKIILLMASPEFDAFLDKKDDNTYLVTDIEYAVFVEVLRFMYTNNIELRPLGTEVVDIWYTACKLGLKSLMKECLKRLKVTIDNVLDVYVTSTKAKEFDATQSDRLIHECLKVFSIQTPEVMASKGFFDLEPRFLPELFDHEPLYYTEYNLLLVIKKLAEVNKCEPKEIFFSKEDEREASSIIANLRNAVKNIRFLEMTLEQFNEHGAKSGFLTKEEVDIIRESIETGGVSPLPQGFSDKRKRHQLVQLKTIEDEKAASERNKDSQFATFSLQLFEIGHQKCKMGVSKAITLMDLQWKIIIWKELKEETEYCTIYIRCLGNSSTDWICHAQFDIFGISSNQKKIYDIIPWFCYRGGEYMNSSLIIGDIKELTIKMEACRERKPIPNNGLTSVSVKYDLKCRKRC